MPTEVMVALIAGVVTLLTTVGTLHVTMKIEKGKQRDDIKKELAQLREEFKADLARQHDEIKAELIKYHEKNHDEVKNIRDNDLKELTDNVTNLGATFQTKMSLLELSMSHTRDDITVLSTRVEKHNNVIERVYHCEDTDKLLDEKITVANHRIKDIEAVLNNRRIENN